MTRIGLMENRREQVFDTVTEFVNTPNVLHDGRRYVGAMKYGMCIKKVFLSLVLWVICIFGLHLKMQQEDYRCMKDDETSKRKVSNNYIYMQIIWCSRKKIENKYTNFIFYLLREILITFLYKTPRSYWNSRSSI